MSLYSRLTSTPPTLQVDDLMAVIQEYTAGRMTGAEAVAALGLSQAEASEALALRAGLISGNGVLVGLNPWQRMLEVRNILRLAAARMVPLDSEAAVVARLGL